MLACPSCHTKNEPRATHCTACGNRIDGALGRVPEWLRREMDVRDRPSRHGLPRPSPALPPIPDGGLRRSMPDWLAPEPAPRPAGTQPAQPAPALDGSLAAADEPIITADDLPAWLRDVAQRPRHRPGVTTRAPLAPSPRKTHAVAPDAPTPPIDGAPPRRQALPLERFPAPMADPGQPAAAEAPAVRDTAQPPAREVALVAIVTIAVAALIVLGIVLF